MPTPSASESTPTDEYVREVAATIDADDPNRRMYLPGRRSFSQRTLSRIAPALLPTPRTNDGTGTFPLERPPDMDNLATRVARDLLPTPTASDSRGKSAGWDGREGGPDLAAAVELLPTPTAWLGRRPENSMADPERAASREHEGARGKRSLELPEALAQAGVKLMPTPTAGDAKSSGSRNLEGSKAHPGVSLTDAVQTGGSTTPRRLLPTPTAEDGERGRGGSGTDRLGAGTFEGEVRLLPTPQAADGDGGRQEKGAMGEGGGKRPSGQKATLPLPTAVAMRETISETPFAAVEPGDQASLFDVADADADAALLPTPVANPDNPGAGGELRAAVVHGEGRRNETGVDTLGRPNRGRGSKLLPTPDAQLGADRGPRSPEKAASRRSSGHQDSTEDAVRTLEAEGGGQLLPTPTAADGDRSSEQGPRYYAGGGDNPTLLGAARRSEVSWGVYEKAIRRWEGVCGREAPAPTDEKGRLAPEFAEWMLGYDEGWFDVPGLKRTAKLRALGNSVQVQCGEVVGYWLGALVESGLLS